MRTESALSHFCAFVISFVFGLSLLNLPYQGGGGGGRGYQRDEPICLITLSRLSIDLPVVLATVHLQYRCGNRTENFLRQTEAETEVPDSKGAMR